MRRRRARRRCSPTRSTGRASTRSVLDLVDSGVTAASVTTPGELEAAVLHALVELPRDQPPAERRSYGAGVVGAAVAGG